MNDRSRVAHEDAAITARELGFRYVTELDDPNPLGISLALIQLKGIRFAVSQLGNWRSMNHEIRKARFLFDNLATA